MYVTYRARLEGTSEIDSSSLISLLEKWVSGKASISVTGILVTVDPDCPVAILSLNEEECLLIKPTPTTSIAAPTTSSTGDITTSSPQSPSTTSNIMGTTDSTTSSSPLSPSTPSSTMGTTDSTTSSNPQSSSENTTVIVGGVVAIVFILVIGIIIVVAIIGIITFKLRSHGALRKVEE